MGTTEAPGTGDCRSSSIDKGAVAMTRDSKEVSFLNGTPLKAVAATALVLLAACVPSTPSTPPVPSAVVPEPECVLGDFPLFITIGELETSPGAIDTLRVREYRGHAGPHDLPQGCSVAWSISDAAPAELEPKTGVLRVAENAPDGATFPLSAYVAGEGVEATVRVVDREQNPLVGHWTEVSQTTCGASTARTPAEPLRELVFSGNGEFSVTWMPFESYKDYWGTYEFDRGTGRLELQVVRGNHVPDELDLDGQVVFEGTDEMQLHNLWLGSRTPLPEPVCVATFRRQGR